MSVYVLTHLGRIPTISHQIPLWITPKNNVTLAFEQHNLWHQYFLDEFLIALSCNTNATSLLSWFPWYKYYNSWFWMYYVDSCFVWSKIFSVPISFGIKSSLIMMLSLLRSRLNDQCNFHFLHEWDSYSLFFTKQGYHLSFKKSPSMFQRILSSKTWQAHR